MSKKYIVATNDFLAVGGDDFPCFNDVATINEFGGLEESLMKYVQKLGTVSYALEGRISIESKEVALNEKAIKVVIDMISKIGENITLKDKEAVLEAKEAYTKLTDKEKALVTNYDKLTKSENKIKEIESDKPDKNENNSQNNNQSNSQNNNKKPTSPQTGDLSMVPFLFGVVASSAGIYVYNKRK